jgi:hypothetical protein
MDVRAATNEFVTKGAELFHLIRMEGQALTLTDLHMLRVQLQILDIESANLMTLKQLNGVTCGHNPSERPQPFDEG